MKYAIRLAILLSAITLASCQTKQLDELSYTEFKQLALELGKRCEQQGVKATSPDAKFCIEQEMRKEISTRKQNKQNLQAIGQGLSEGFKNYGAAMGRSNSISCTSRRNGEFIRTNCY